MEASLSRSNRNPFSDPVRLWGMGILSVVAAAVFVPRMVAPWQAGELTPELMRMLLNQGAGTQLALLLFPIALGALVLTLRPSPLVRALDNFGGVLDGWRQIRGSGKFTRFFVRPFVGISGLIWDQTAGLRHPDWRSSIRITLQTYIVGLFIFLAFTAAMILLVLVAIGITFAIISALMGGSAGVGVPGRRGRVVESRPTSDWLGEKVDHYDETGQKVAESRPQSDLLGDKVVHTASSGETIGESREQEDLLGKKAVHYAASGEQVGESRLHSDLLGEKVDHYSTSGEHVGASRPQPDLLGGRVAHEGKSPIDQLARKEGGSDEEDPDNA